MQWNRRLSEVRKRRGLSQEQVAAAMGKYLPERTSLAVISTWESGRTAPKIHQALALAKVLDADVNYLFSTELLADGLNDAGLQKLGEYRQLLMESPRYKVTPKVAAVRQLPVYLQAASAGTGQWLDDAAADLLEVDESVPASAEFGVRLAGDSMEPRFTNGQIVWARHRDNAGNGEIVLCYLDGQSYCKMLHEGEDGVKLISLNKAYEPIAVRPESEFRIFGTVVG